MDQFDGIGGSYIVDPKTGERKLVERTIDPNFQIPDQPVQAAEQPTDARGE
jgi:hypothetical protein